MATDKPEDLEKLTQDERSTIILALGCLLGVKIRDEGVTGDVVKLNERLGKLVTKVSNLK